MRVGCLGECMVELVEHPDGTLTRGFGGDTLNTALYLARLGIPVDYITALGDDPWSDAMVEAWAAEGIGLACVRRLAGRRPGLYIVRTDAAGERSFHYWRETSAARDLFAEPGAEATQAALTRYDLVYLSGVSLSLYGAEGCAALGTTLGALRASGGRVAFDTNYRPAGWPETRRARAAFEAAMDRADLIFASVADLDGLYGPGGMAALLRHRGRAEIVLKDMRAAQAVVRLIDGAGETVVPAPPVATIVDTTAAGDSFAAGYLAARFAGAAPVEAARAGHRLAGAVIQHRGAVIPRAAMPILIATGDRTGNVRSKGRGI
jgi:2-dehydro-3-deoxygluconokinase